MAPTATQRAYLPRIVDHLLRQRLRSHGAVLIEGPKACGKTSTARQLAASEVRLDADVAMRRAGRAEPDEPVRVRRLNWSELSSLIISSGF